MAVLEASRFWTRPKIISAVVIAILLLSSIVCIYQSITIQQRQSDIQGKIGDVWNEVDRASQLLQQDAALLNMMIASQNDAIVKIAQARSNMVTIIVGQGTSDTNAALAAATRTSVGIRSFVDSYPDYRVGSKSHSVLVQIEGSFYSRCTCWVVRRSSRRRLPSLSSHPIISSSTTSLAAAELRTLER